jgi:hypothetical protein
MASPPRGSSDSELDDGGDGRGVHAYDSERDNVEGKDTRRA